MGDRTSKQNLMKFVDFAKGKSPDETVSNAESAAILELTNRIKALEEFLDPTLGCDPRKLYGGTD